MTSPETATTPIDIEANVVDERAFTISSMEELRASMIDFERLEGETDDEYLARYEQHINQVAGQYVADHNADARYQAELVTVLRVPNQDWRVGPRVYKYDLLGNDILDSDGNHAYSIAPSGVDKVRELQYAMFSRLISEDQTKGVVAGDQASTGVRELFKFSDDQSATRAGYAESDQALAQAEARRFRVGMFAGKEKRNQLEHEIEPVAAAYTTQALLFDTVQEQKYRTMFPDINDEDLAKKMASYHTAKQRLHDLRVEHEAENGYHKFGFLSKMHNTISTWYGGLSRSEKLGVAGAGVAAAGLLGLALGPLGAVGVGVMAGAKGYRSYMQSRSELYQRQPKVERIKAVNEQNVKTLDELQTESRDSMTAARAARIERTDKVNKRARITTAIGGLILGGGLAVQTAEHWGDIQHFFGGGSAPHDGGQAPGGTQDTAPANPPKPDVKPNPIAPSDTPGTADALRNSLPGGGAHDILDPQDATAITPGEGLYETFQEMGIPQPMWHDVMNDVGPQLQQLGDTYWDPTHAEWRISHTGQFSDKAMKIMAAAVTKHGYSLAA